MRNRRVLRVAVLVAGVLALVGSAALADRGAIVAVGKVDIEEPAQRAIIAYNGSREILILQTDVKADKETKVVEFMPLPSKPKVSLAPKGCFAALQKIVKDHNLRYVIKSRGRDQKTPDKTDAVKVVVSAQLGPHAVTVVEVKDADAFVKWVRKFFQDNKLGEPALGGKLREIVANYLKRDMRFFAFDIVTLSPKVKTVQPLAYDFKTDHLYYPLKVTNLYGGTGTIELFLLMPSHQRALRSVHIEPSRDLLPSKRGQVGGTGGRPLQPGQWRFFKSTTATITPREMAALHAAIPTMMGDEPAQLRAVKYEGPLDFDSDLWVATGYPYPVYAGRAFFRALENGDAATIERLVSVPFAFDRKKVITDKKELMKRFAEILKKTRGKRREINTAVVEFTFDKGSGWRATWPRGTWPRTGTRGLWKGRLPHPAEFDVAFVEQHLKRRGAHLIRFAVAGESVWLIFQRRANKGYKIFGFSD